MSPANEITKPTSFPPIPVSETAPRTIPAVAQATQTNGIPCAPFSIASMNSRVFIPGLNHEAMSMYAPIITNCIPGFIPTKISGFNVSKVPSASETNAVTTANVFCVPVVSGLKLKNDTSHARPIPNSAALIGV